MQRADLEHLIRASAGLTNEYEIVVIGSQSILGAFPNAPVELLVSMEADVYPLARPDLADLIDGSIGEGSPFHDLFGYYAEGVGPQTATLPEGWLDRTVKIQNQNTDLRIGICLEPHDLAAAKLVAGREKDWVFVGQLLAHSMVDEDVLCGRIRLMPIPEAQQVRLCAWVRGHSQPDVPRPERPA